MEDEDDQDIYDDGTSITNRCAVGRIKSMFEPALQGPKPSVPSKPMAKPPPPKRMDDTKLTQNGDVSLPHKNNVIPKRNIGEIANKNRDENSNVKNGDVQLNPELVSKFNKIKSNLQDDDKPSSKPPWVKEISPKPEINKKPTGKIPTEGFASRVKMFDKIDNKENTSQKADNPKPSFTEKLPGITDKKEAISGIFQAKISPAFQRENQPPITPVKPEVKKPPPTPVKPSTTDQDKILSPSKPKFPIGPSPISAGGGPQSELMRAIQRRKESIDHSDQSEEHPKMRNAKRTKSVKRKSLTRMADNKKFYLVEIHDSECSDTPPPKPRKLSRIDLDQINSIVSEYKKKCSTSIEETPSAQGVVEEDEELYEELPGDDDDFPPPPAPEEVIRRSSNRPVSLIPTMTEDEELIPDDVYDEGFSAIAEETPPPVVPGRPPRRGNLPDEPLPEPPKVSEISDNKEEEGESDGELYEPLDDVISEVAKMEEKNSSINEEKTEQLSEKERKKREKEEKKRQEEERKKQEKKMKELKSKFKIEPGELLPENSKGNGVIKEDAKGKGKDLPVKKDQRIVIICMDKRVPKGKWLVKFEDDEDTIGYVDSNNVEVMTGSITKKSSFNDVTQDDQEEYEAIEPEQDEVYSEAM